MEKAQRKQRKGERNPERKSEREVKSKIDRCQHRSKEKFLIWGDRQRWKKRETWKKHRESKEMEREIQKGKQGGGGVKMEVYRLSIQK